MLLKLKFAKNEIKKQMAVVILAAGNSSRMGTHKALLKFDDKYNFIQKIVEEYKNAGCEKIIIVANSQNISEISASVSEYINETLIIIENQHPEWERFYSLKKGLEKIKDYSFCFIQNCDNPFVSEELILQLIQNFQRDHVVIPEYNGLKGHPILLCQNIIKRLIQMENINLKLNKISNGYKSKIVQVADGSILLNINTIEEYEKLFSK